MKGAYQPIQKSTGVKPAIMLSEAEMNTWRTHASTRNIYDFELVPDGVPTNEVPEVKPPVEAKKLKPQKGGDEE